MRPAVATTQKRSPQAATQCISVASKRLPPSITVTPLRFSTVEFSREAFYQTATALGYYEMQRAVHHAAARYSWSMIQSFASAHLAAEKIKVI